MVNQEKSADRDDLINEVLNFANSFETSLEPTLSVSEINETISMAIAESFPQDIWVKGEVQRLNFHTSGHIYFNLVDSSAGSAPSTIPVTLLKWSANKIKGDLRELLAEDREVRLKVRPDFYAPYGKMSLHVSDVDTTFTLGNLALARRELLEKLDKEGILRANAEHEIPDHPLDVVLVTSVESAAYHDVIDQLKGSGIGFRVRVINALMQGGDSVRSVVSALKRGQKLKPDVILLCRGGGAKSDLATFDNEAVARCIASANVPVLTGLGHQIDVSVADIVAHMSLKTPTACAQFLIEHVLESNEVVENLGQTIFDRTSQVLSTSEARIANLAQRIGDVAYVLERCETKLSSQLSSIRVSCRNTLMLANEKQNSFKAVVAAGDPARILERGFSLTTNAQGKIIRSIKDINNSDEISTRVADGEFISTVTARPKPAESKKGK